MIRTKICQMLDIKYPIILGGMGILPTLDLAKAVCDAGGLGVVRHDRMAYLKGQDTKKRIKEDIEKFMEMTDKPFGVNIRVAKEQLDANKVVEGVIEEVKRDSKIARRLKAIITAAGDGTPYVEKIKEAGILHIHKGGSVYHAKKMEKTGVDAFIAVGYDGTGHISFERVNTFVLIPAVVEAVNIPVIAGGGIYDARTLVAALALGAEGVEIGTRFVATCESPFPPEYKQAIVKAKAKDTVVGIGEFGNIRLLRNTFTEERVKKSGGASEDEVDKQLKEELEEDFTQGLERLLEGDVNNAPVPIGQVAERINEITSVKEIVGKMMSEASEIIKSMERRM
jgi:NAD(P)H-dependent flavin oxidoreductase YrpB (nitropropane dioxygenase family)